MRLTKGSPFIESQLLLIKKEKQITSQESCEEKDIQLLSTGKTLISNDWTSVRHILSGSPSSLYDQTNLDWLLTLNLAYELSKFSYSTEYRVVRYEKAQEKS